MAKAKDPTAITVRVIKGSENLENLLRQIENIDDRKLKDIAILTSSSMLNYYTVIWDKKL